MRGGFGQAGRYRHKKSQLIRNKEFVHMHYVGKKGFTSVPQKTKREGRALNLGQLSSVIDRLVNEKKAEMDGKKVVLNLNQIGFQRLLGGGSISRPIRVTVDHCSKSALEKIKESGGEAILPTPAPAPTPTTTKAK
jgi:large subunit ribosomal protein L15